MVALLFFPFLVLTQMYANYLAKILWCYFHIQTSVLKKGILYLIHEAYKVYIIIFPNLQHFSATSQPCIYNWLNIESSTKPEFILDALYLFIFCYES
jgi:hypothetical protein